MEILRLYFDQSTWLSIQSREINSIKNLVFWEKNIQVFYCDDKQSIKINEDFPGETLETIKLCLQKLDKILLDWASLKEYDIGFIWNDYLRDSSIFIKEFPDYNTMVSGLLLSTAGCYTVSTWLYINEKNQIIFEITPDYPWMSCEPKPGENFIPYKKWMLHYYKPLVKRVISRDVVQRWLPQVEDLYEKLKQNDERLRCKGEGCEMCEQEKKQ